MVNCWHIKWGHCQTYGINSFQGLYFYYHINSFEGLYLNYHIQNHVTHLHIFIHLRGLYFNCHINSVEGAIFQLSY